MSLRDRKTQESRGAHLLVEAAVVLRGRIQLSDAWLDLALREGARCALHLALRIGQREVQWWVSERNGGSGEILSGRKPRGPEDQPVLGAFALTKVGG